MEKPSPRIIRNDPKRGGCATWNGDGVATHWIGLALDQRRIQCRIRRVILFGAIDDLEPVTMQVAETQRSATTLVRSEKYAQWMRALV